MNQKERRRTSEKAGGRVSPLGEAGRRYHRHSTRHTVCTGAVFSEGCSVPGQWGLPVLRVTTTSIYKGRAKGLRMRDHTTRAPTHAASRLCSKIISMRDDRFKFNLINRCDSWLTWWRERELSARLIMYWMFSVTTSTIQTLALNISFDLLFLFWIQK